MQLPELPSVPHAVKAYDVRRALNDRYLLVRSVERQGLRRCAYACMGFIGEQGMNSEPCP
jgi:hypothetical protein